MSSILASAAIAAMIASLWWSTVVVVHVIVFPAGFDGVPEDGCQRLITIQELDIWPFSETRVTRSCPLPHRD